MVSDLIAEGNGSDGMDNGEVHRIVDREITGWK